MGRTQRRQLIVNLPGWFDLAMVYATALHLTGETGQTATLTRKILEILPVKNRHRREGIQTLDTLLQVAMVDNEKALQSLREWREIDARPGLTEHRMVPVKQHKIRGWFASE